MGADVGPTILGFPDFPVSRLLDFRPPPQIRLFWLKTADFSSISPISAL
jgi:hypothetical protein